MDRLNLTGENVIEIWYSFALEKPKPTVSLPQEEWISVIESLKHDKNIKAKTYAAAFFNGDVKIIDGKDKNHKELVVLSKLHQDQIQDLIYSKVGEKKLLVSCSLMPYPELIVTEIDTHDGTHQILGRAEDELADMLRGWNQLA